MCSYRTHMSLQIEKKRVGDSYSSADTFALVGSPLLILSLSFRLITEIACDQDAYMKNKRNMEFISLICSRCKPGQHCGHSGYARKSITLLFFTFVFADPTRAYVPIVIYMKHYNNVEPVCSRYLALRAEDRIRFAIISFVAMMQHRLCRSIHCTIKYEYFYELYSRNV